MAPVARFAVEIRDKAGAVSHLSLGVTMTQSLIERICSVEQINTQHGILNSLIKLDDALFMLEGDAPERCSLNVRCFQGAFSKLELSASLPGEHLACTIVNEGAFCPYYAVDDDDPQVLDAWLKWGKYDKDELASVLKYCTQSLKAEHARITMAAGVTPADCVGFPTLKAEEVSWLWSLVREAELKSVADDRSVPSARQRL